MAGKPTRGTATSAAPPNAVLRVSDQRRGVSPTACVKTGVPTTRAVRVRATAWSHAAWWDFVVGSTVAGLVARALRRPTTPVVVAVSPAAFARWRRTRRVAAVVTAVGLGVLVSGLAAGGAGSVVSGAVVALAGWAVPARERRRRWFGLTFRPAAGEVLVTRVHPAFAEQARQLYVTGVLHGGP